MRLLIRQTIPAMVQSWPHAAAIAGGVFFLLGLLFLLTLDRTDLVHSHEARAAQHAHMMLHHHRWGLPTLCDGRVELQKPPLYYWLVAATSVITSGEVTVWSTRLPAPISGMLAVAAVAAFLLLRRRPTAAIVAAIVLATAIHFTATCRIARIDVPLTAATTAAILAWHQAIATPPQAIRRRVWLLVCGLAAGAAILLKGPVGLALIVVACGVWLLTERTPIAWGDGLVPGVVAAAVGLPWFIWADRATDGELFRVFILHHNLARFAGTSPLLATHPWWYYLPRYSVDFLPWTPLAVVLIGWAVRRRQWSSDPQLRLGVVSFAAMFVLLSTAQFKRADYLLPAYPFAAMAVGCAAERWWQQAPDRRRRRWGELAFHGHWLVAVGGWLVFVGLVEPQQHEVPSAAAFARQVRELAPPPQRVILFRMESHLLSWHVGPPQETLIEWGELQQRLDTAASGLPQCVVMPQEYVHAARSIISNYEWRELARWSPYARERAFSRFVLLEVRRLGSDVGGSVGCKASINNHPPTGGVNCLS